MNAAARARAWLAARRAAALADDRPPGDTCCRNCGADAPGRFCPSCGQETRLALPGATQFLRDAAGRYVAFDGKMWRTLAFLFTRPGFLTREYLAGRRARYVRPARLVLVLSILLFAAIRLTSDADEFVVTIDEAPAKVAAAVPVPPPAGKEAAPAPAPPPVPKDRAALDREGEPLRLEAGPASIEIDDRLDVKVSGLVSPLGQRIAKRFEGFNRLDRGEKLRAIVAGMIRYGPYALVAMLPAFALLMQLLYLGRSTRYPGRPRRYAEHLVYGAHNHAFVALAGVLAVVIPGGLATTILAGWIAVYLVASMHVVYGGRWIGVIARSLVAVVAYAVFFALAVLGLFMVAVLLR